MAVLLLTTGGTIASRPTDAGVRAALSGAELLVRAGLGDRDIEVRDLAPGPSWAFTPAAIEEVARTAVGAAGQAEVEGVVVTHGTDTVEETLFATWLLGGAAVSGVTPIVFTGAMRHAEHAESDGPVNLREAVALAQGGGVPGPVLRIGGATHHARWARKRDTSDLGSFESAGRGAPGPPPLPPAAGPVLDAGVQEVHSHAGIDAGLLDHLLDRGATGVVLVGTGAGNVHASLVPGIERALAGGVPVVVTSRCWSGAVAPEYGGPGGGRWLADAGAILAGDLPTNKARLALAVAVGADPDVGAVRAWFGALLGAAAT